MIGLDFAFGLPDCVEDFIITRSCSIHFSVTLSGLKNAVRYTREIVI